MTDQRQSEGSGGESSIPCPFRDGGARGWKAWINAMPGPDAATLIVVGEVNAPEGYAGRLRFSHADRMRPPNQYLELTLVEKGGAPGGWSEVRAQDTALGREYASVVILCHDERLETITDIEVVH
jgi:hypothetical protein